MGGLGAREREAIEKDTVEGAVFESVGLVVGSGRPWRGKCACSPEGMRAVPCPCATALGSPVGVSIPGLRDFSLGDNEQ